MIFIYILLVIGNKREINLLFLLRLLLLDLLLLRFQLFHQYKPDIMPGKYNILMIIIYILTIIIT